MELLFHELCLRSWHRVNPESVRDLRFYRREGKGPVRPTINVLDDDLLGQIVTEAKRVLAEVGLEIRGRGLRERLLEAGLPLDASGERILFPREPPTRLTRPRSGASYVAGFASPSRQLCSGSVIASLRAKPS